MAIFGIGEQPPGGMREKMWNRVWKFVLFYAMIETFSSPVFHNTVLIRGGFAAAADDARTPEKRAGRSGGGRLTT